MNGPEKKGRVIRTSGLGVFALVAVAAGLLWWMFLDEGVRRGIEETGASVVGARVDLAHVDVRASDGSIRLEGLQVANPDAPMTNLIEAEEISVDLLVPPLLEKKVVVESFVMRGVRFGTPREVSGALENPDPESGALWRQVNSWADQVQIPTLSLEGLGGTVDVAGIDADSLPTVRHARALTAATDSMRSAWEERARSLDPRPRLDSARALVERLESFRLTPLNALQAPGLVRSGQGTLSTLTTLEDDLAALDGSVKEGVASLQSGAGAFSGLRAEDFAYARGLLHLPSFDAPEISPALFGSTAVLWLKPVMYWARTAERFLPPGLDPRQRPGPKRARAEGTTVAFPGKATYPSFLLQEGEVGLEIGGSGAGAGAYTAHVRGLSSAPSLVNRPVEISVARDGARVGPVGLSLDAVLDHTGETIRDSVALRMDGVSLPAIELGALGGTLHLGDGSSTLQLARVGENIRARMRWTANAVTWSGGATPPSGAPAPSPDTLPGDPAGVAGVAGGLLGESGSPEWARAFVWRSLTGIRNVELEMSLEGTLDQPRLSISSNLGEAVARSLQEALGEEVAAAEARVRAEVERQARPHVESARSRVEAARTEVAGRIDSQRQEAEALRTRLESRLEELMRQARIGG
ncbi:MAG: hypothetical protein OEZ37_00360 [Gemmatimonadota bacterium]|nr:hypothetical protein [Gemmatimonadota bacterium]